MKLCLENKTRRVEEGGGRKEDVLMQRRPGRGDHALWTCHGQCLGWLGYTANDAQIEIGRLVVDGPIVTVAVCIMGEQNKREKYIREPATGVTSPNIKLVRLHSVKTVSRFSFNRVSCESRRDTHLCGAKGIKHDVERQVCLFSDFSVTCGLFPTPAFVSYSHHHDQERRTIVDETVEAKVILV